MRLTEAEDPRVSREIAEQLLKAADWRPNGGQGSLLRGLSERELSPCGIPAERDPGYGDGAHPPHGYLYPSGGQPLLPGETGGGPCILQRGPGTGKKSGGCSLCFSRSQQARRVWLFPVP